MGGAPFVISPEVSHPPVDVPRRSSDERVPVVAHGHLLGAILAR
nr:MAG TPA: hypothetical protein [Bacteriophage sp.]